MREIGAEKIYYGFEHNSKVYTKYRRSVGGQKVNGTFARSM